MNNAERQQRYRDKKRNVTESVTRTVTEPPDSVTVNVQTVTGRVELNDAMEQVLVLDPATLEHYVDNPSLYIPRQEPDKLNWGVWMNSDELKQAGLKANRAAIPGDWDYKGVA